MLTIVGLGPGDPGSLTQDAETALKSGVPVLLRTAIHPTVARLKEWQIPFESLDEFYENAPSFDDLYTTITAKVVERARQGDLVYAVPGHPLVAERTTPAILASCREEAIPTRVVAGLSALDALFGSLQLDPVTGVLVLDALDLHPDDLDPDKPTLVLQLYSRAIASEVKVALLECYPDETEVVVVTAAGLPDERHDRVPLAELDRLASINHLSTLFLPASEEGARWDEETDEIQRLVDLVTYLRSPEGCPWDREQTPMTLRKYVLEEAYETVAAIESGDPEALEDELGDLLLQVVLQSQLAREDGHFDLQDVAQRITDKLIRRHPHVFGEAEVEGAEGVKAQWEVLKKAEYDRHLLDVPLALPALERADKVSRKAAAAGFDWPDASGPLAKIHEEIHEVERAQSKEERTSEMGDLLFSVVNWARHLKVSPEEALRESTNRFIKRFERMERQITKPMPELTPDEWESLWQRAKAAE